MEIGHVGRQMVVHVGKEERDVRGRFMYAA